MFQPSVRANRKCILFSGRERCHFLPFIFFQHRARWFETSTHLVPQWPPSPLVRFLFVCLFFVLVGGGWVLKTKTRNEVGFWPFVSRANYWQIKPQLVLVVNDTSFSVKCFCILDLSPLASKTTHHFPSPWNQQPSRPTRTMGHKQAKRNLQPHLKTCSFLFYRFGLGPEDLELQQTPKGLVLPLVSGPHFEKQRLRWWFSSSVHAGAHQWNLSPWGETQHWVEPGILF